MAIIQNMLRKARLGDVEEIFSLLSLYAREGLVLPLSTTEICERIREFAIYQESRVLGCAALRIFDMELAEIRSVAVVPEARRKGIGKALVNYCLKEAEELGLKKVFVLTKNSGFFEKCGFQVVSKRMLPQKVWKDCMGCPKFPECDEIAMIKYL